MHSRRSPFDAPPIDKTLAQGQAGLVQGFRARFMGQTHHERKVRSFAAPDKQEGRQWSFRTCACMATYLRLVHSCSQRIAAGMHSVGAISRCCRHLMRHRRNRCSSSPKNVFGSTRVRTRDRTRREGRSPCRRISRLSFQATPPRLLAASPSAAAFKGTHSPETPAFLPVRATNRVR